MSVTGPLSVPSLSMLNPEIFKDLTQHLGTGRFLPTAGRGNSRVGIWENNQCYFVKIYPQDPHWERRKSEQLIVEHYLAHGISSIPPLVHSNAILNYSVFEHIQGTPPDAVPPEVFSQIQQFLKAVINIPTERFDANAKEAFFHTATLKEHINSRLEMLARIDDPLLQHHLNTSIKDAFQRVDYHSSQTQDVGSRVIVSPSDFGTHNSLLSPDGRLHFIDFEYGGLDSLFKLLGDIYWHPGSRLTQTQRMQLIRPLLQQEKEWELFRSVCMLMGLKWSLLLLNEFIPDNLRKRLAAQGEQLDALALKHRQLEKSNAVLTRIGNEWIGPANTAM